MIQNRPKIPNNIEQLEQWTASRVPGRQQKLLRFKTLLKLLDISVPPSCVVKLAGTNGKGSVATMLEAIFLADDQKVVLFTSPHLFRVTERIRVDGVEISRDILNHSIRQLVPKLVKVIDEYGKDLLPSLFEVLNLIALEIFKSYEADIIILEAGIGGYFDITHLVPAKVSIITNVGLDHTDELGTTFSDIAKDKVGIASPNSTLVLGSDIPKSAFEAILEDTQRRGIDIFLAKSESFKSQSLGLQGFQITLNLEMSEERSFILPLIGSFQLENLATAKAAFDVLKSQQIVRDRKSFFGISQVRWPGRMELIPGHPAWLLDVAHNSHAIEKIATDLPKLACDRKVAILLGLSDHNNIADIAPYLKTLGETIQGSIYLASGFYRAIDPSDYISIFKESSSNIINLGKIECAIDKLLDIYKDRENTLIFVTGSLFLIGSTREYIQSKI